VCWLVARLDLDPDAAEQLTVFVDEVADRLPELCTIPYGPNFLASLGSFAKDGSYSHPENSLGLTCSSFVTEILHAGSIHLVLERSWTFSEANNEWISFVAKLLDRKEPEHAKAIRGSFNGLRLMPTEVAGAATLDRSHWPVTFDNVQMPADRARQALADVCSC
jgi:hypothetical protein